MKKLEDVSEEIKRLSSRLTQVLNLVEEVKGKLILYDDVTNPLQDKTEPEAKTVFDVQCSDLLDCEYILATINTALISINDTIDTPKNGPTKCIEET